MVVTICFYITAGLLGLFGLALIAASIASLIHNTRRDRRVKQYTTGHQSETPSKENQLVKNDHQIIINQPGCNHQKATIGYIPYNSPINVNRTIQANTGNRAEKSANHKSIKNKTNTSKIQRNNAYNINKHKHIPKAKFKNKNVKSNYNQRIIQYTYRHNNFT
ncbi:MAG: hypothetical protein IJT14_02675 [Rickettsiales bacterium]|nr:hypothetical protein [Rickettsiales bacterium]